MPESKTMFLQKQGEYGLCTDITVGSCEQGNDLRDCTKVTDIADYPKDYKLLKEDCCTEILFRILMFRPSRLFRIVSHSEIMNYFIL